LKVGRAAEGGAAATRWVRLAGRRRRRRAARRPPRTSSFSERPSAAVLDLVEGDEGRALDVLQEGAAAGGDVRHLVGQAEFLDGLGRLAAADDGDRLRRRQRLGDGPRPLAVRLVLELAQGAVPDDRVRLGDLLLEQ